MPYLHMDELIQAFKTKQKQYQTSAATNYSIGQPLNTGV